MKKLYIKPDLQVVKVEACKMIADSLHREGNSYYAQGEGNGTPDISEDNLGREVIRSRDAWEEW